MALRGCEPVSQFGMYIHTTALASPSAAALGGVSGEGRVEGVVVGDALSG